MVNPNVPHLYSDSFLAQPRPRLPDFKSRAKDHLKLGKEPILVPHWVKVDHKLLITPDGAYLESDVMGVCSVRQKRI